MTTLSSRPANSPQILVLVGDRADCHRWLRDNMRTQILGSDIDQGRGWLIIPISTGYDLCRLRGVVLDDGDYGVELTSARGWPKTVRDRCMLRLREHLAPKKEPEKEPEPEITLPVGWSVVDLKPALSTLRVWRGCNVLYQSRFPAPAGQPAHVYDIDPSADLVMRDGIFIERPTDSP